jgi:acetyltransferase
MIDISPSTPQHSTQLLPDLVEILCDAVLLGASMGFLPPLSPADTAFYWSEIIGLTRGRYRILFIAQLDGMVAGTVQLNLETRPNGSHRAEVSKLIVHSAHRRQGVVQALMQAVEAHAVMERRSLRVLNTRAGDAADHLYSKMDFRSAGIIPKYARGADGTSHGSNFMYKFLA